MTLPKLSHPTFELVIPSTKQKIRYRPFLVKEEKILLIAQSSQDPKDIVYAVKQVLQNCCLDELNVDDLTTFDIEYFFIKLRSKSVNSIVNLKYRDLEDDKIYDFEVDLETIEIDYNPNHQKTINVSNNVILNLKYPQMNLVHSLEKVNNETDLVFEILRNCLDTIVYESKEIKVSDYSVKEIDEFIMSMDVSSFNKVQEFFNTMPKLRHEIKYVNNLGNPRKIVLQSLNDFFQLG